MKTKSELRKGFSLVEVALAMGIAAFCMIPLVALIPLGLSSNQNASAQVMAAGLLRAAAADLMAAPIGNSATDVVQTPQYGIKVPDANGTVYYVDKLGNPSSTLSPRACYRVEVATVSQPSSADDKSVTLQRIRISWPAQSSKNVLGTLDTLVALERH